MKTGKMADEAGGSMPICGVGRDQILVTWGQKKPCRPVLIWTVFVRGEAIEVVSWATGKPLPRFI